MRWLGEYRIKTNLRLEAGQTEIDRDYDGVRIMLRNAPDYDHRGEGLMARMIFNAEDLSDAEFNGDDTMEGFLNLLCLSTNVGARIAHRTYLAEWPEVPGAIKVYQYVYTQVDEPYEIVNSQTLASIENLDRRVPDDSLVQAFSWYNSASRSTVLVDQFQLFWFVIETLSTKIDLAPTPDLCSCGGSFVCDQCGKASTKSASRKKIDQVLRSTGVEAPHIKGLSKVRNMLLHGSSEAEIEAHLQTKMKFSDFTMAGAVTTLADCAWIALAQTMKGYLDADWPTLPHADAVKTYRLIHRAEMGVGLGQNGEPIDMNSLPIGTFTVTVTPTFK